MSKQSTCTFLFQIESLSNYLRSKTSLRDWLCSRQNLDPEKDSGFLDKLLNISCHDELLPSRTAAIDELVISVAFYDSKKVVINHEARLSNQLKYVMSKILTIFINSYFTLNRNV